MDTDALQTLPSISTVLPSSEQSALQDFQPPNTQTITPEAILSENISENLLILWQAIINSSLLLREGGAVASSPQNAGQGGIIQGILSQQNEVLMDQEVTADLQNTTSELLEIPYSTVSHEDKETEENISERARDDDAIVDMVVQAELERGLQPLSQYDIENTLACLQITTTQDRQATEPVISNAVNAFDVKSLEQDPDDGDFDIPLPKLRRWSSRSSISSGYSSDTQFNQEILDLNYDAIQTGRVFTSL